VHTQLDPERRQLCTESVPSGDIACHHTDVTAETLATTTPR
jgi:hypothetical protein